MYFGSGHTRFRTFLRDEVQVQQCVCLDWCHTPGENAVCIVVLGMAHFHTKMCAVCSLVAIFDVLNEALVHIGMQQLVFLPAFSHLGVLSGFLASLLMSSRHNRHTGL